jgi:hypothetical protein
MISQKLLESLELLRVWQKYLELANSKTTLLNVFWGGGTLLGLLVGGLVGDPTFRKVVHRKDGMLDDNCLSHPSDF